MLVLFMARSIQSRYILSVFEGFLDFGILMLVRFNSSRFALFCRIVMISWNHAALSRCQLQ